MKNVLDLSRDLSDVVGYMPHKLWGFLIKHFICPITIVLFALGLTRIIPMPRVLLLARLLGDTLAILSHLTK